MDDRELAVAIARCDEIPKAELNLGHPCAEIVHLQRDMPARHVPEAWFGNLPDALVLFVASNPSIDRVSDGTGENYPKASWSDDLIGEWMTRRTDQTWSEVPVTFGHPQHNNFLSRCEDGLYRGSQQNGNRTTPQKTWNRTHTYATEMIGPEADPARNYVLTEIVHCKSEGAQGVAKAAPMCTAKWMDQVTSLASEAHVLVLFGTKVRDYWVKAMAGVPTGFGQRRTGLSKREVIHRNSYVETFGELRRVAFYLPHPSASGERGETLSVAGIYGEAFRSFIRDVIAGNERVPTTTAQLHSLF